jgi:glyoxylase-like metal-dependent hydrolase (beta-lactamase superfamily II)
MTLDGTNTWLLSEPGSEDVVVVDPGPEDPAHLDEVVGLLDSTGRRVVTVLLTHGHPDHADGAKAFAERTRAPVRALDPAHRLGSEGLVDGDVVAAAGLEIRVLGTPGHSSDSLSFTVPDDDTGVAVLTGDTILGRGTTVVAFPDGRLHDYLLSLKRLAALGPVRVLPGHGPELADAAAIAGAYLDHRRDRLAQVEEAVAAGAQTAADVVQRVYADVDPVLWPAAERSVRAQLDYLRGRTP